MQEAETPSGTDGRMREAQGLAEGDVHMVDAEREEHMGWMWTVLLPAKTFDWTKMKMKRRRCIGL